ncbi:initiation factor 2 subunit family protein [Aphelenchoides avenae]|nr:initiation factor 2 subunit family protein [Aphelenchus avenae]
MGKKKKPTSDGPASAATGDNSGTPAVTSSTHAASGAADGQRSLPKSAISTAAAPQTATKTSTKTAAGQTASKEESTGGRKELKKSTEELTEKINKLKASSPSGAAKNPASGQQAPTAGEEQKPSREEVKSDRKAKKDEKAARKAAALQKKEAQDDSGKGASQQQQAAAGGENKKQQPKKEIERKKPAASETKSSPPPPTVDKLPERGILKNVRFGPPQVQGSEPVAVAPPSRFLLDNGTNVHPSFRRLFAKCEAKTIVGVEALCVSFIGAFREFLFSYRLPPTRSMRDHLLEVIQPQLSCLTENGIYSCPLALGNLIRQLKKQCNALPEEITLEEGVRDLKEWLDDFYRNNFQLAEQTISQLTLEKLRFGVGRSPNTRRILTYSWSPLVEYIILRAVDEGIDLHVSVVDDAPKGSGLTLVRTLADRSIPCTYGLLSSVSYQLEKCDVVLLGCSAILSNGYAVVARGSSLVALNAHAVNLPVLIAAKTYQFVDKVRSYDLSVPGLRRSILAEPLESMPDDLITALVTDIRILPPSSAPAVLKSKQLSNE